MTPGKNRRHHLRRDELASGRWCYQVARKAISATFTAFLEYLLVAYPAAPKVAVICDNTIIHRSQLVQRWLAAHPRWWCCTGHATAPTTTRSSASGRR
jgi:hypothetical protein